MNYVHKPEYKQAPESAKTSSQGRFQASEVATEVGSLTVKLYTWQAVCWLSWRQPAKCFWSQPRPNRTAPKPLPSVSVVFVGYLVDHAELSAAGFAGDQQTSPCTQPGPRIQM